MASSDGTVNVGKPEIVELYLPPVMDAAEFFQEALAKHFKQVTVKVGSCIDLRKEPFGLVSEGLGGSPFILQIGGMKQLLPLPQLDKLYNLNQVLLACGLQNVTLYGAAPAPFHRTGKNGESAVNFRSGTCANHVTTISADGESTVCEKVTVPEISFLGDLFGSNGLPGRVLHLTVKQRTSEKATDLPALLRQLLMEKFPGEAIGMGGVMVLKRGSVKSHVMKEFAKPLAPIEFHNLGKLFTTPAPLVIVGSVTTSDCGIALRESHWHMLSHTGDHGGHYGGDAEEGVEYDGYFTFASRAIRVDRPL